MANEQFNHSLFYNQDTYLEISHARMVAYPVGYAGLVCADVL
jgi:hypothetical protein